MVKHFHMKALIQQHPTVDLNRVNPKAGPPICYEIIVVYMWGVHAVLCAAYLN